MEAADHFRRFIDAQRNTYDQAFREVSAGRKTSHWMWFIFPQLKGLGYSEMARRYALEDIEQARGYLEDDVLGRRLTEISKALLAVEDRSAYEIFGSPDDMKLHSCMTLFSLVPGADPVFQQVLDKYFNGQQDRKTLDLLRNYDED